MALKHSYINTSYLDLMSDGETEMKLTILDMILTEAPVELQRMREHASKSEWDALFKVAHKMKSTTPFIGYDALTTTNAWVEQAAKTRTHLEEIPARVAHLVELYQQAEKELEAEKAAI